VLLHVHPHQAVPGSPGTQTDLGDPDRRSFVAARGGVRLTVGAASADFPIMVREIRSRSQEGAQSGA
jgi:hypothetical protein